MKVFPPSDVINLYDVGLGDGDPFNRSGTSKSLSELVERIEDPLVIAIDGGWGSGKTWFLQRWVGAHKLENDGRATTVYFDAFAHDFMDDPLIALTGVIGDRLPKKSESGNVWGRVKKAAARLAKPVTRIGIAMATGGATEFVGPVLDAGAEAASKEIEAAAEAFWAREDGKRAAMQQLRGALKELTMVGDEEGGAPVPLVVVVDELDRCRPDYALALLEVIKHFFSVSNVHFVLGVNLDALQHSVRARYGDGFDAERYLRRFISISMTLPDQTLDYEAKSLVRAYFHQMADAMGISTQAVAVFDKHLEMVTRRHNLTMRDAGQILSRLALVNPDLFTKKVIGWHIILCSLILFRLTKPELERRALNSTLTLQDVQDFYGITPEMLQDEDRLNFSHPAWQVSGIWEHVITNGAQPGQNREHFSRAFDVHGHPNPQGMPRTIYRDYLSKFAFLASEK